MAVLERKAYICHQRFEAVVWMFSSSQSNWKNPAANGDRAARECSMFLVRLKSGVSLASFVLDLGCTRWSTISTHPPPLNYRSSSNPSVRILISSPWIDFGSTVVYLHVSRCHDAWRVMLVLRGAGTCGSKQRAKEETILHGFPELVGRRSSGTNSGVLYRSPKKLILNNFIPQICFSGNVFTLCLSTFFFCTRRFIVW